jgi:hypothetical protein
MATQELEQRVSSLERDVAELKQGAARKPRRGWLMRFVGAFDDEPAFDDVVRYAAEMRQAENSIVEPDGKPAP